MKCVKLIVGFFYKNLQVFNWTPHTIEESSDIIETVGKHGILKQTHNLEHTAIREFNSSGICTLFMRTYDIF